MIQQELSEWTTNKVDRKVETPLLRPEWKLLGHIFFFSLVETRVFHLSRCFIDSC